MKKIAKLQLSQLNKDSMVERQMAQLMGGTYCYWSEENQKYNEQEGKCSCICWDGEDYYMDATYGLHVAASILINY